MGRKPTMSDVNKDEPIDRFADVFHSFKDLHNVSPIQFFGRLERRGVTLAWKSKRRLAPVGGKPE